MNTNPSVLIIDSDQESLGNLSFLLKSEFVVFKASSGKEGLSLIGRHPISIALFDLHMTDMKGLELLRRIRADECFMKVMILTSKSCHDSAMECANLNVQGYIKKPFDAEELVRRIKKVCGMDDFMLLQELWKNEYEEKISTVNYTVKNALTYIEQNYHSNVSRDDLANYLNFAPDYVSKLFYKESGIRLKKYIDMFKISKCKASLSNPSRVKIKDVAKSIGMEDVGYFCRYFKKHTDLTPGEFRKKNCTGSRGQG